LTCKALFDREMPFNQRLAQRDGHGGLGNRAHIKPTSHHAKDATTTLTTSTNFTNATHPW
jgi:hypothetical protein